MWGYREINPARRVALAVMSVALCTVGLVAVSGTAGVPSADAAATSDTLYVDASGSDANSCAVSQQPCQTVSRGVAQATAGLSNGYSDAVVNIAAGTYAETVIVPVIPSGKTLSLVGAGAASTTINAGGQGPVIAVRGGVVSLNGVTLTGGARASGGGGIVSVGTLTIMNSTITGNTSVGRSPGYGGGILNYGGLTVTASTISGNTASIGGGVYNIGSATITNSTVSGNSADLAAGIYNDLGYQSSAGTLLVTGSTVADNKASLADLGNYPYGGGITNVSGSVTVADSILSGDTAGGAALECAGTVTDGRFNVTSDNSCGFTATEVSTVSAIGLGSLAANGSSGPQTMAITTSSSAHAVVPAHCSATDERGLPRPGLPGASYCDAGAYELQQPLDHLVLSPSPASITAGQTQTFKAEAADANGNPLGNVTAGTTFSASSGASCTGAVCGSTNAGTYTITGTDNSAGTHATGTASLTVTKAATTVMVSVHPGSAAVNQAVTLTATVHHTGTGLAPSGTVSFYDGNVLLGTAPVQTDGTATLSTSFGGGRHQVRAVYSGDTNYTTSTSSPATSVSVGCNTTITGVHSAVVVTSGTTCIVNATITGGISVGRGAVLDVENSTVQGSISASHPAGIRICGSTAASLAVSGATGLVRIGDPANSCTPNTIAGGLIAANNTAGVIIINNTIGGAIVTAANTGTPNTIAGNHR
ncbi:MAG: Ig-like domain-containing protein [Actinomycetota bacterium]|nr:Ig-like domain-containing protein [Actinomycetota bacterium]